MKCEYNLIMGIEILKIRIVKMTYLH